MKQTFAEKSTAHTVINALMYASIPFVACYLLLIIAGMLDDHLFEFTVLWLFIPLVALWLGSKSISKKISQHMLISLRACFIAFMVLQSGVILRPTDEESYDTPEESDVTLGHRLAESYDRHVSGRKTSEDVEMDETQEANHWYQSLGLWAFDWILLIACVTLPIVTWMGISRGIRPETWPTGETDTG
jgi:hypothetical protein